MENLDYRDPEWVSEKLGLERNTVYKYLQEGIIPAVRFGRKWLISEKRLIQWLEKETLRQTEDRQKEYKSTVRTTRKMDNYSPEAKQMVKSAHSEARRYGHRRLDQGHLLMAVWEEPKCIAAEILNSLSIDNEKLRSVFEKLCPAEECEVSRRLSRTSSCRKAMRYATKIAENKYIKTHHLLIGIMMTGKGTGYDLLTGLGLTEDMIKEEISKLEIEKMEEIQ